MKWGFNKFKHFGNESVKKKWEILKSKLRSTYLLDYRNQSKSGKSPKLGE